MNRDYYYFREILIGLREEYLKNQVKVQNLKQYIQCSDKRIDDFYLSMDESKETKLQICFNKKEQLKFIRRLLNDNCVELEKYCYIIRDFILDNIYIKSDKYKFELDSSNIEILKEQIDTLFQTDFVKNIDLSIIDYEKDMSLFLKKNRIRLMNDYATLGYYSSNGESINFWHFSKDNMIGAFLNLLDTKISKNYFSLYHQEIINKNKDLKDIHILSEEYDKQSTSLELVENNNIILCKKKKI